MKNLKYLIALLAIVLVTAATAQSTDNKTEKQMESFTDKGVSAPKQNFTGTVWVNMNVTPGEGYNVNIGTVTFEPKARTNWHSHRSGQILFVTEGIGYYQEKGKAIRLIRKGDVVKIPKTTMHWHGASTDNAMRHIALVPDYDNDKTEWFEPVSDEDYNKFDVSAYKVAYAAPPSSNTLNTQQKSLTSIAALTATGDMEKLKVALNRGLEAGITINEIKEALTQLYAYCGFPRSLNAITLFMDVLKERKAKGLTDKEGKAIELQNYTNDKYEQGRKVLEILTKSPQIKPAPGFGEFAPRIDAFLKEHLFADIFYSDVLTYQQRELVTISALAAMPGVESQLQSHIKVGLNTGITKGQLTELAMTIENNISKKQAAIFRQNL